jgi:hypothetical protein
MSQKFINALRNELSTPASNIRMYANGADGQGSVITYSFDAAQHWGSLAGYRPYSDGEIATIRSLLGRISAVADIQFVETDHDNANFFFTRYDLPGSTAGQAMTMYYDTDRGAANPDHNAMSVVMDTSQSLSQASAQGTLIHETLHMIGLDHPHEGVYRLPSSEDKRSNTIMSYKHDKPGINKLGVLDIAALQSIYGPAKAKMGNNTYSFGKDKLIWDGGGIDTISASGAKSKVVIDLNDGSWNYIGRKASSILAKDQVHIGEHTIVERATGSRYSDKLYGNSADNVLRGGSGDDLLNGRDGNDLLSGDAGNDKLYGGAGNDTLKGSSGNDFLQGQGGADLLYGGSGKDKFSFVSYADMGTLDAFDSVRDFSAKYDKFDFSKLDANADAAGRQKLTFLGNGTDDVMLGRSTAGQFYFDTADRQLRFDANGDNTVDHVVAVNMASMKSAYFLL